MDEFADAGLDLRKRRPKETPRVGSGRSNATFGELLQGALDADGNNFMVTLPIAMWSSATLELDTTEASLRVWPPTKRKSARLARLILAHFGVTALGRLSVRSLVPEGKGLASSSADLVATARAVSDAIGQPLPQQTLLDFLRLIEPSDGVMYRGSVLFFHRQVEFGRTLGPLPRLRILAIDEGGEIDTIAYNRTSRAITRGEAAEYARLLSRVESAFEARDFEEVGRVATRSAVMNQRRNPKKHLHEVIEISKRFGALGVAVTHSGPCVGVLVRESESHGSQIPEITEALRGLGTEVMDLRGL